MLVPEWYTPFHLRESWLGSFQPVVGLTGLDLEGDSVDRRVWELLNLGTDLAPTFVLNPTLPRKKPRREGLEQSIYVPEGIFPIGWTDKHRSIVPAVIVVFFKDDGAVTVTKALSKLRDDCAPFGTQLLVMLIKGPGEEEVSTERASALCAAADIPPKSLYILVTSHPDRIHSSVHRLERGIRDVCTSYYAGRVRRLKTNKERTTQLVLHVRYNVKLAFFFEIRRDYGSAIGHYEAAFDSVVKLGTFVQEVKVVAALVTYRLCRIHLLKREWVEGRLKFHKMVDTFKRSGNNDNLFEVLAFLEQQYQHFGDLVKQYYGHEATSCGLDPVNYYIVAAKYAQQRAEMAQQKALVAEQAGSPPVMGVDLTTWEAKYLGQRPWQMGDTQADKVPLLEQCENQVAHSDLIIKHLGLASEFCKEVGHLRTRCQLMSMMGDEFLRSGEYARAILLMAHVLREFGKERWATLLLHVAQAGLRAAIALPDVPAYLNFVVILLKVDLRGLLGDKEAALLGENFDAVVENRVPRHDGREVTSFAAELGKPGSEVKSYVGVHSEPFLSAWIGFAEESVLIHRTTRVVFRLQNRHGRPVHVKSIAIQTNIPEYDGSLRLDKVLEVGARMEESLEITPRELNKVIQLQVGVVDIGRGDVSVLLHYSLIHKVPSLTLWKDEWGEEEAVGGALSNVVKVEGSRPLVQCRVERDDPALVGEAHKVTFFWTNGHPAPISRVLLTFFLSTSNPQLVRLSPDPALLLVSGADDSGGGSLSYSLELDNLAPSATQETTLFLRVLGETEVRLISKVKYVDSFAQPVTADFFTVVGVVAPFGVTSTVRDRQGEVIPEAGLGLNQPFLLLHEISNVTKTTGLKIANIRFKEGSKCVSQRVASAGVEDVVVKPGETISAFQMLQLVQLPVGGVATVGVVVQWRRDGADDDGMLLTTELSAALPRVEGDTGGGLYLTGEFGEGHLKRKMTANYVLLNRGVNCCDLTVSIDSTEFFMNAGPKRMSLKLNGGDHVDLSYILFPLKTGLVVAPRLLIEGTDGGQNVVVYRDHPKTVFIRRIDEGEE